MTLIFLILLFLFCCAFGISLDNVAALSSIKRQAAIASTVVGYRLFGTIGTLVPAGTQFSVSGSPTSQFTTDAPVTLAAGTDEVQTISFDAVPDAVGDGRPGHVRAALGFREA